MFVRPNFSYLVLVASLQWDSFEQFCVWQLLSAEGSDPAHIIPILANLNAQGENGCRVLVVQKVHVWVMIIIVNIS